MEYERCFAYKRKLHSRVRPPRGAATVTNLAKREIMSSVSSTLGKGLEGIVATNSSICYIDGDEGILAYRGIDIHELADHSSFEEVCYLLWFGRLPKKDELQQFKKRLAESRKLNPAVIDMMRNFPKSATPMEVLRTTVSSLSF